MEFDLTEPLYVKITQELGCNVWVTPLCFFNADPFLPDRIRVYMNDQTEIGGPRYSQNEGERKNLE